MLIDDVTIKVQAGKGGNGAVAFSRTKMTKGPTGANGGPGGNVYLEGVSDLGALNQFRHKKDQRAAAGEPGDSTLHDGAAGADLILKVPVGTVVHYPDMEAPLTHELVKIGERLLVAKGGKGGKGNFHFRSAHNTTPRKAQDGLPGQARALRLELKLIADVGFVGLPNAGKSSLLNALTNASAKVANYPFTTLEPNIGAYYDLLLADIPGLIEGASSGKGLGVKFLRHVERTKTLVHLVSAESDNPVRDYRTIRSELTHYSDALGKKEEHVFLSKADLVSSDNAERMMAQLSDACGTPVFAISAPEENLAPVIALLSRISQEKQSTE